MTTAHDLTEAFHRAVAALAQAELQPGGPERIANIRRGLCVHLTQLADAVTGRDEKCRRQGHGEQPAHNCRCCASEAKGRADDETPWRPPITPELAWTRRKPISGRSGQITADRRAVAAGSDTAEAQLTEPPP